MDLTKLTTSTLKSISGLTDKLSATIDELKKIEQTILASLSPAETGKATKLGPKPKVTAVKAKASAKKVEVKSPVAKVPKTEKTSKANKAPAVAKSGKYGAIKEQVLAALQKAGTKGSNVKDLSEMLGLKPANLNVWFSTTGRKSGIEKVSRGVYRLKV